MPGLVAGTAALAFLHGGLACGGGCAGSCSEACTRACVGAGLLAGLALAFMLRERARSAITWMAGGALAALLGLLGCPELAASHALSFGATLVLALSVGLAADRTLRVPAPGRE